MLVEFLVHEFEDPPHKPIIRKILYMCRKVKGAGERELHDVSDVAMGSDFVGAWQDLYHHALFTTIARFGHPMTEYSKRKANIYL